MGTEKQLSQQAKQEVLPRGAFLSYGTLSFPLKIAIVLIQDQEGHNKIFTSGEKLKGHQQTQ